MSRCRPFALSILTFRPSLAVNSSIHVSTMPLLPLPFLYPSRCVAHYRRESLTEVNENLPFSNDRYTSDPESGSDDPWAFLWRATPPHRPKAPYVAPSYVRDRSQPNSTITEREREIFAQIFESILSENSSFVPQVRESGRSFPSSALTELFESAVGPLANGNEISFGPKGAINPSSATVGLVKASDNKEYPLAFRFAAAQAAGLKSRPQTEEGIEAERHRAKIFGYLVDDMQKCKSDWELLRWLDKNLFSMVSSQDAESERKIPSAVYADLLVEGMITFRQSFNDLAGAMSVFERVKGLGAESYVVGCSIGAYNEMLQAKWEAYKDVSKIVELVDEMNVNGVEGSQKTMEILRSIIEEVGQMKGGLMGLGAQSIITDVDTTLLDRLQGYVDVMEERSFEPLERDPLIRDSLEYVHG